MPRSYRCKAATLSPHPAHHSRAPEPCNPDVADVLTDIRGQSRPRHLNELIAQLADAQHGVVARYQLAYLGLSKSAIDGRLASGYLRRLHRGVYAVGHTVLSAEGHYMAAVLAFGPGAVLAHRAAGAHWSVAPHAGTFIEVIPATPGRHSRPGLRVHSCRLDPRDRTVHEGIPVTTVARTLIDLAEVVDLRRLTRAIERAEKLDLFDLRELDAARARARGHHGLAPLAQALAIHLPDDHSRSDFERDFIDFCASHDLPPPRINAIVEGYEVDVSWPGSRLIIELDSWTHHRTRAAFEKDRIRDANLALAGYRVIRLTWRRLNEEPAKTAAQIQTLLQQTDVNTPKTPRLRLQSR